MKKRTKKNVRRMLSIVLALMMCISLTCPVFAADEMDGSPGSDVAEVISQSDEQESETGDVEATETEKSTETGTEVEEQPETNGETTGTVETATSSNAGESGQADGDETGNTNDEEQVKEDEIPAVIQEFLKAVDAVLNFGDVTEENAEEYHALYEAAMDAYKAVEARGLESNPSVIDAMELLEAKGDIQPADNSTDASKDDGTDQLKGEDSGNIEGDEQQKEAVIQAFLDAVAKVKELDEVTEDDPLYQAAMDAYKAVEAKGLENDERVKEAKETLEGLVKKAEENSNVFEVSDMFELMDALATINSSAEGNYTISLKESFTITNAIGSNDRLTFGKDDGVNRNITLLGNGNTITFETTMDVNFWVRGKGTVLNLGNGSNGLTIQGSNAVIPTAAILTACLGSTINMYSNVTLKDYKTNGFTAGAGVSLQSNSTFNMYGGTISNCISLNNSYGGGVCIGEYFYGGTFNMSGGIIENCSVNGYGGGVCLQNGVFNMSGNATIENCNAVYGGGVFTFGGRFTMSGNATITGNRAEVWGGGVSVQDSANVTNVYNNTAGSIGDDILATYSDKLTLSPVGSNWTLTSTGRPITNWYYDGYRETGEVDADGEAICDETRWTVKDVEEECYLYEYSTPADNVSVALKAAHGMAEKVTVTYIADDNVIGEETQVKGSTFTVRDALESTTADKEFDYWSGDDGNKYEPGAQITPKANLVLTAVMKDRTADYKVEWWTIGDEKPMQTKTRNDTVGKTVTVTKDDKTAIEGYTFKEENANNVLEATVAGDGSTVLKLYFTKDPVPTTYTVKWYDANGKEIKEAEKREAIAGETVSVEDADKDVEGYTFDEGNANNVLKATVAEDGSTVLKLYFTKKSTTPVDPVDPEPKDANYKVEWYDVDGNSIKKADTRTAKAGTEVTVTEADKTVEGYTFDEDNANNVLKATVAEDVTTVLKLYFTKNSTGPVGPVNPEPKDVTYKVEWYDVDGNSIKKADTRTAKAGTEVTVTEADKTVEGYTFDKNNANNVLKATVAEDGSTVLKLYFTKKSTTPVDPVDPKPKDVTYKVEWYDVDGNSIKTTETRSAKAGTTVSVKEADKVVEGYTFDANNKNNILTAVVAEDGSTVLKLYFTKKSTTPVDPVDPEPKNTTYKVEWYNVDGNKIKATETRSAKAGTTVSVKEADKVVEGYTFDANNKNNILTAVVAEDGSTVLKLYFTKNSTPPTGPDKPENPETPKDTTYKVEWYDVDGNSIKTTEVRSAKAGTTVSVTEADKVVEGYTFDANNKNNILTAVVAEDGSTVLKLYFTKIPDGPNNNDTTPPTTPTEDTTPSNPNRDIPKTGDTTSNWALYLMLASGLALIVLLFAKRKEDK